MSRRRYTKDADEPDSNNDGSVWIKGVPKGNTRVRILQPTSRMPKWREHYEPDIKAFMCDEQADCPGCTDADSDVQKRTRKYGFNYYDQTGRLSIMKIGTDLFKKLQRKEQWHDNTLLDRDWILIREGERLETTYDVEAGEKYPLEKPPTEIYDIDSVLGIQYWEARRAYGLSVNEEELLACQQELMRPAFSLTSPGKPTTDEARSGPGGGDEAQAEAAESAVVSSPATPATWTTAELKAYLTDNKVDFPEKAPRSRLVNIADEHMAANPPF